MLPFESAALAAIVTTAGATYEEPAAGAVNDTVGGVFDVLPLFTVMLRATDVATAPRVSRATAVNE
jgi:hypothetical protein